LLEEKRVTSKRQVASIPPRNSSQIPSLGIALAYLGGQVVVLARGMASRPARRSGADENGGSSTAGTTGGPTLSPLANEGCLASEAPTAKPAKVGQESLPRVSAMYCHESKSVIKT